MPVIAIGLLMLVPACKPTEKNYQSAYEVAQRKKQAEAAVDPDMVIPAGGLQSLDAPRTTEVGGEKLIVKRFPIKGIGDEQPAPTIGHYNVAVAKYKMPTNAKAQTEDLVAAGYDAFAVQGSDGYYYVVAAVSSTLEEAVPFVKAYKKSHKPEQLIGLEGDVLIIEH